MTNDLGEIYAILNGLTWGIAIILYRKCGETNSPLGLSLFKNAFSIPLFIFTLLICNVNFIPELTSQDYLILIASSLLGLTISDTLLFKSINSWGASNWAIIDCLYSPFLIILGYVLLNEKLEFLDYLGGALVISAAIIVAKFEGRSFSSKRASFIAMGIAVLAVLTNTLSIVIVKPVLLKTNLLWVTSFRCLIGFLSLGLLSLFSKNRKKIWNSFKPKSDWRYLIPGVFMGNYVAITLWVAGFKYANVGIVGILNKLSIVVILILSTLFLNEKMTSRKILAATIGISGAILVLV